SFTLTVTTKNQGVGASEATTTSLYLSMNAVFEATDTRLTDLSIAPLAPGASVTSDASVTIPSTVTGGTYYLFAVADTGQIEAEGSETNNSFIRSIKIGPDLQISTLSVPLTGVPGGVLSISSTVTNSGGGNAGTFAVTFYLSTNYLLDAADVLLSGSRTITSLAAGASSAGGTDVTIPAGTAVGTYVLIAKADGNDQ